MSTAKIRGSNPSLRLSPTSYLVLGLIGLRGPSTPYEIKRAVGRTVSYFWPFPHSQLYDEPERLAGAGLLSRDDEMGGRRRKIYALTDAGRQALQAWLKMPPDEIFELRDMAVLQLFFSEFSSREHLIALAKNQIHLARERLATYQAMSNRYPKMRDKRRMAPMPLGVSLVQAYIDFWSEIAKNPPKP